MYFLSDKINQTDTNLDTGTKPLLPVSYAELNESKFQIVSELTEKGLSAEGSTPKTFDLDPVSTSGLRNVLKLLFLGWQKLSNSLSHEYRPNSCAIR